MLAPLLLLSSLLFMQPDWNLYSTAKQVHQAVREAAERNSGVAEARRRGEASSLNGDVAVAAAAGYKSWMRAEWAHESGLDPAASPGSIASDSSPPGAPLIQLLTAASPHGSAAPLESDLPDSAASDLLRWMLSPLDPTPLPGERSLSGSWGKGDQTNAAPPPLRVLYNFGEHGREIISSEIALELVRMLDLTTNTQAEERRKSSLATAAEASSAVSDGGAASAASASEPPPLDPLHAAFLLSHASFTILPLLNAWSHERVETGSICERKNAHGVDLNRNWDFLWNGPAPTSAADIRGKARQAQNLANTNDEQFPGPRAFSEPESRTLRDVAAAREPHLYINFHSGITEMYTGWDHRSELVPNADEVMRVLRDLTDRHCHCPIGGAGAIGGYMVFGGSMDYLYSVLNVSHSLTVEVYGGERGVSPQDCFRYFNPDTKEKLDATKRKWARIAIEAANIMVREKRGVEYPFRKEEWMESAAPNTADAGATLPDGQPPAPMARNYYTRMDDILLRLDSLFLFARTPVAAQPLFLLPNGSPSPAAKWPPSSSSRGGGTRATTTTWKAWVSGHTGITDSSAEEFPAPNWNDACTPLLPALPHVMRQRLDATATKGNVLPLWQEQAGGSLAPSPDTINVLVIGGALWNDFISTELLCSWLSSVAPPAAAASTAASVSLIKLWILPSLFSHARVTLLESPSLHSSFCSAALSPDARVQLLAHQLYATQTLVHILYAQVRPRIVLELRAERFIPSSSSSSPSSPSLGGASSALGSFMHVEATSLRPDLSAASSSDGLVQSFISSMESSISAAPELGVSWSVRSHAAALRAQLFSTHSSMCPIGHVDVEALLLHAHTANEEQLSQLQPSAVCPSCELLITVFVHGAPAFGNIAAAAQTAEILQPGTSLSAEAAEAAAFAALLKQRESRAQSDRFPPDSYVAAAPSPLASGHASAEEEDNPQLVRRSVRMAHTRMEQLHAASLSAASSSSGALSTPPAASSSPPSPPPQHWCDFHTRNPAPHTPERVLALHVSAGVRVLGLLRGALESVAASGNIAPLTDAAADVPPFQRPRYIALSSADVPSSMPPHARSPALFVRADDDRMSAGSNLLTLALLVAAVGAAVWWRRRRARAAGLMRYCLPRTSPK